MAAEDLRAELANGGALRALLDLYTQALFVQIAQASACNRLHSVDERCARWLLLTNDRAGDEFRLSHRFLAQMLGVRRATVSEVAARFRARGLIAYTRGTMRIESRARLERVSCECYALIRSEYERLLGDGEETRTVARVKAAASRAGKSVTRMPDSAAP
jgi:hypothetical protein